MKRSRKHGRVLAHRWFSRGEGWAYHPDLEPTLPDLVKGLSPELNNRGSLSLDTWRQFSVEVPGGVIVGIHRLDPNCPDRKATGRAPSVLIGVLVAKGAQIEGGVIANALAALTPEAEGADPRLLLENMDMKRKKTWRKWIVRGLLAAIPVFVLSAVLVHGEDKYDIAKRKVREVMIELSGEPSAGTFSSAVDAGDEDASWQRFCSVFCRPAELPDSSHPDALWLGSLLSVPDGFGGTKRWNPQWKDYIAIINQWAKERKVQPATSVRSDADANDVTGLLRKITDNMDYQTWLKAQMVSDPAFRRTFCVGSVVADPELRKHSLARGHSAESLRWQTGYAKPLQELMADWDVKEVVPDDVKQRPWFVIQTFFAFLNRERFQAATDNAPYEQFVRRLPATNVLHKADYDITSKRTVDDALTELLTTVSGTRPSLPLDPSSAAARLQEALDYDAWSKGRVAELVKKKKELESKDDLESLEEFKTTQQQLDAFDRNAVAPMGTSDTAKFANHFMGRANR